MTKRSKISCMTFKKFINQVLIFFILFFVGFTFSSFVVPDNVQLPQWYLNLNFIIRENWPVLALIISEVAAIIPGKTKGILHAVLQVGDRITKKTQNPKIGGSNEN